MVEARVASMNCPINFKASPNEKLPISVLGWMVTLAKVTWHQAAGTKNAMTALHH